MIWEPSHSFWRHFNGIHLPSTKLKEGYTGFSLSVCPSVRHSVCPPVYGRNRVRFVSSIILTGCISVLHILFINFKFVAWWGFFLLNLVFELLLSQFTSRSWTTIWPRPMIPFMMALAYGIVYISPSGRYPKLFVVRLIYIFFRWCDNVSSPVRLLAVIWTNAGLFFVRTYTHFIQTQ